MTEYELIDVVGQHTETMLSLLQWWVGITLGILVSTHVINKELNGYIASLLIALYVCFTAVISMMASAHRLRQELLLEGFADLAEQGEGLGKMSQWVIETGGPSQVIAASAGIAFWGLFLSTISYVIYRYRKVKRELRGEQ